MKTYKVTVNGSVYEVTVELTNETGFATAPAAPAASAPSAAPAPAAAPATAAPADGAKVNAPLPGTILSINANVGASVKKGDVLMILEALKMENEVLAPCDGTVKSVSVTKGQSVESGALLCVIG
jgi:biotin carboxyl carrier protein